MCTTIDRGGLLKGKKGPSGLGTLLRRSSQLAGLGHTDGKGMPHPLQLALTAREFSDVIVFRSPPPAVQRAIFGALAPIARWRGSFARLGIVDCLL